MKMSEDQIKQLHCDFRYTENYVVEILSGFTIYTKGGSDPMVFKGGETLPFLYEDRGIVFFGYTDTFQASTTANNVLILKK